MNNNEKSEREHYTKAVFHFTNVSLITNKIKMLSFRLTLPCNCKILPWSHMKSAMIKI